MKYNPDIHHRQSIRLKEYDYSQNGAYFITIATQNRECIFGNIANEKIKLNDVGKMVHKQWNELPNQFNHIKLDEYIVMPNHFHGIIIVGAPLVGAPLGNIENTWTTTKQISVTAQNIAHQNRRVPTRGTPTNKPVIGTIVGAFKSITTCEYINGVNNYNWPPFNKKIWQRNYYEHIIRNEKSLEKIREYVINNPHTWEEDQLYCKP